jgi:hypothetical protein
MTVGRVAIGVLSGAGDKETIFGTFADRGLGTSASSTFEMADTLDLESRVCVVSHVHE